MLIELILALSLIGCLLFLFLYKLIDRKSLKIDSQSNMATLITKNRFLKQQYSLFTQKAYVVLMKLPFLKGYVRNIRVRLETVNHYDEFMLRRKTMQIVFTTLGISGFIIFIFAAIKPGILFLFVIILTVIFLNGTIIDVFVHRLEDRLLRQVKESLADVRHHFQQTKMVDEAVYQATQLANYEAKLQANRIYNILTSELPTDALREYESVAPNRFLKAIAGISVLVQEKGDVIGEKGSVYLEGLSGLTKEINYEIIRRERLSYVLKGLSVVSIAPIFFTLPIRKWATTYFPAMEEFYNSRFGLLSQISLYMIILISYMLIRKMREASEPKYSLKGKQNKWEAKLLKLKPIQFLVDLFTPEYYQKQFFKITLLLKHANSPLKLDWLYLHRLLITLFTIISITGFFLFDHYSTKNRVLYSPTTNVLMGQLTPEEEAKALTETEFDRSVIMHFKEGGNKTYQDIVLYVSKERGLNENDREAQSLATRVYGKLQLVETAYLKWWEVVIAIAAGFVGYHFPIFVLKFQVFMRKMDMEDEVNQLYTIIDVISKFKSVSVLNILEWMERFSVIFKEPLNTCLLNFESGQEEALNQLKEDVSFVPFSRLVDRLQLAVTRISIQDAFDDIDIEKQFYLEQRSRHNDQVINEKAWWGQIVGLAPLFTLIFLYLVIPMLYISITQTSDLMNQIKY